MGSRCYGGTMGAYLARAGHDVTFGDTVSEHFSTVNANGIHVTGPLADFSQRAQDFTPNALPGEWDTIILPTKPHHTEAATHALRPHLSANGCVISAQNGLNELAIAEIIGSARTVGAFVNFGADYLEPGVIHYG